MSAAAPPKDWRRITGALLAIVFLNGMLSFRDWWPTPGVLPDHRLSPEFVWVWLALLAVVAWRGALSPRSLNLFTFAFLLLVLGRYADVTVPSLFGRPINLYWDGANIPRFLWVAAQEKAWWQSAGIVALVVLLFWGLFRLLRALIAIAARDAAPYALRTRWGWVMTSLAVLLAVLDKRAGLSFAPLDVFLNVVGGLRMQEPAGDLAVAAALASSVYDQALPSEAVFIGEVGLGGEVRPVSQTERRLAEAAQLGFRTVYLSERALPRKSPDGIRVVGVGTLGNLFKDLFR